MDNFFDDLCRTLAAPISRKRAFKLIAGGLAGVVLAPFAFGQGKKCSPACICGGTSNSGGTCCSPGQTCYTASDGSAICCGPGQTGAFCTNNGKTGGKLQCTSGNFSSPNSLGGNCFIDGNKGKLPVVSQGSTCH